MNGQSKNIFGYQVTAVAVGDASNGYFLGVWDGRDFIKTRFESAAEVFAYFTKSQMAGVRP